MGEAAGMTTYSRQGDLVAMATNKDVCIRGESQRSAAEGTHAARLTVMENRLGPAIEEEREGGGMPAISFPQQG